MRARRICFAAPWLLLAAIFPPPVVAVAPRRTVSPSQQFIIYCDDLRLRNGLSEMAEETKSALETIVGSRAPWKLPIVITVTGTAADSNGESSARLRRLETEDGGKVSLELAIGSEAGKLSLQSLLVRSVLLEYATRDLRTGAIPSEPPLWLIEGLTERMRLREIGADASLFQSLLTAGHLPTAAQVIGRTRAATDSTSRALDAACAFSLLQLLVDLPTGPAAIGRYLRGGALGSGDPVVQFAKSFPQIAATPESLEKWWALSVARLSAVDRYRGLDLAESNRQLDAALRFQVPGAEKEPPKTLTLEDWRELAKGKAAAPALRAAQEQLRDLAARCHPMLREPVQNYETLVSSLLRRKTRGFAEKIAAAAKDRAELSSRMTAISDYLNWFEASAVKTSSGTFSGYLDAARETPPPPRNDPVSRYLDTVVAQSQ